MSSTKCQQRQGLTDAGITCGHITKEKQLVKLGLIPESLKYILVVPENKEIPNSKRIYMDSERVITAFDLKEINEKVEFALTSDVVDSS